MTAINPVDAPWDPLTPMEVAEIFRPLARPWWVAGGYAMEHVVGRAYRPHSDVDVLVLRRTIPPVGTSWQTGSWGSRIRRALCDPGIGARRYPMPCTMSGFAPRPPRRGSSN